MLLHVATLPCETLVSAKQAFNDKLQGSVTACLRCGGVVRPNNQIKKGLLLSLRVKKKLKSVNSLFGKVTSKNVIVSCTFVAFKQCVSWPGAQSA